MSFSTLTMDRYGRLCALRAEGRCLHGSANASAAFAMALAIAADGACDSDSAMDVRLDMTYSHMQAQIATSDSGHPLDIINGQLDTIADDPLIDDSLTDKACIEVFGSDAADVAASLLPPGGVTEVQETLTPRASLTAVISAAFGSSIARKAPSTEHVSLITLCKS